MLLYESESVELKEIHTSDLRKEIVAFANAMVEQSILGLGIMEKS